MEQATLKEMIRLLDIRPPLPRRLFGKLSGGNQQKVLLGKWLLTHPALLVLDDPTLRRRSGAREKIFEILRDAAAEGVGGSLLFDGAGTACGDVLAGAGAEGGARGGRTCRQRAFA